MTDCFYVLKQDTTGLYLADSFYHLTWTKSLAKAKRFLTQEAIEYAVCKCLTAHSALVAVHECALSDLVECDQEAVSGDEARTGSQEDDNFTD